MTLKRPIRAIIVGAGHRSLAYASYALEHPDEMQIVGVADPSALRREQVVAVREREDQDRRKLLLVEVPAADKLSVAGFLIRQPSQGEPVASPAAAEDPMVCRCERVKKSEILTAIRAGERDMNQLKAIVRSGMGGCGGKTCTELILRIFREEGIDPSEVTLPTIRPLVAEVHLGDFVTTERGER